MYQTSHPPYQLSQPILGIPVMATVIPVDHSGKHHRPHTPEASCSKALFGKQNASRNPPPINNYRLPIKFSTSNADGVYVVAKVVRHYHPEQFALNLPKELLRVAFLHKPKYITVIDGQSRLFNIPLRTKHKNRKTAILGKGFKAFMLANNLRRGNVIAMFFNPNYPDQLHYSIVTDD
ncbi:hypothetical protein PIB30_080360 [Stylosanthes scabra]|uniref:TF-B3 domain-containing protein n=1 Tax=Stylosanthes scabra TaxID=79078 RepID=A0ABU6ZQ53_9FABA|nr:hypothetical protein [Stylosanthes scabra]